MFKLTVLESENQLYGGENDDMQEMECGCQWHDVG